MKKEKLILVLSIFCLLSMSSCSDSRLAKQVEEEERNDISDSTLVVDIKGHTIDNIKLSSLISDVGYIVLQSDGKHMLTLPTNIKATDSLIYVSDLDEHLFCFSSNGTFLRDAAIKGHSAKEVIRLYDYEVDKRFLYLLDGARSSIIKFNHDGNFLSSTKLPFRAIRFKKLSDKLWAFELAPYTLKGKNEEYMVAVTDNKFNIQYKKFVHHKGERNVTRNPYFENKENGMYFAPINRRGIYKFNSDGTLYMKYYIEFHKPYIEPSSEIDGYQEAAKENIYYTDCNPIDNSETLVQQFVTSSKTKMSLFIDMKKEDWLFAKNIINDTHNILNFSFTNTRYYNINNGKFYAFSDYYVNGVHSPQEIAKGTSGLDTKSKNVLIRPKGSNTNGIILTYKLKSIFK